MKKSKKIIVGISILVVVLVVLFLIFQNTPNSTGNVINEQIENSSIIQEENFVSEENISEQPKKDMEIEITETNFSNNAYIDSVKTKTGTYSFFGEISPIYKKSEIVNVRRNLIVKGILTNNLNETLNELEAQVRFYNELSKDKELVYLNGIINVPLEVWATNQYVNRHAFFENQDTSYNFPEGVNQFELMFPDIPAHISRESLLDEDLVKNKDWFAGNYDIDFAELIIYNKDKEIERINLELPQRYLSDVSLNITGMNWINPGGHRTNLDSLSFVIKNSEQHSLENPFLVFTAYDIDTGRELSNFDIEISEEKIEDSVNYVRLVFEEDYTMKFDEESLSHLASFELYDGDELIDANYFIWDCEEREFSDTLSYFPCLKSSGIFLIEDSGVKINIIEIFEGGKENYYSGIEVKVEDKGGAPQMQNPVIEFVCGNSWVYDFDVAEIEEFVSLDFGTGASCIEPQVFLREKDSPIGYAEDTYLIEEQIE